MIGPLRVYGVGGKMFRRLTAVVLVGEAFVFFFFSLVAWSMNRSDPDAPATAYLVVGLALAVVSLLTSGLLRRPWGITVGWALQVAGFAAGFVVPTMLFLSVILIAVWATALVQGDKMDDLTARRLAQENTE